MCTLLKIWGRERDLHYRDTNSHWISSPVLPPKPPCLSSFQASLLWPSGNSVPLLVHKTADVSYPNPGLLCRTRSVTVPCSLWAFSPDPALRAAWKCFFLFLPPGVPGRTRDPRGGLFLYQLALCHLPWKEAAATILVLNGNLNYWDFISNMYFKHALKDVLNSLKYILLSSLILNLISVLVPRCWYFNAWCLGTGRLWKRVSVSSFWERSQEACHWLLHPQT